MRGKYSGLLSHFNARREVCDRGIRAGGRLFHEPANRCPRDAVLLRDLRERHAGAAISNHLLPVYIKPSTPDLPTFEPSPAHTRPNSFDDDAPLKLSHRTDYDKDRPAERSLGVDSFTLAQELDAHPVQLVDGLEQVFRRTSQPVARPHQQYVEPVSACIVHHPVEFRSPRPRTAVSMVDVLANDCEALVRRELPKLT